MTPLLTYFPSGAARAAAGDLAPYNGPWGFGQAAHLLRRTMFSAKKEHIQQFMQLTMHQAIAQLLTADVPAEPIAYIKSGAVAQGSPWASASYDASQEGLRLTMLQSWWIGVMLNQTPSLTEKMTLFWHNHFATGANSVKDARYIYKQNALLRNYALGNFKQVMREITFDPAMLRWLSGNTNTKTSPNENYGRELQELFTIGKGKEIAPGNYTNYTEADVKTAARVLTGWKDNPASIAPVFTAANHDAGKKTFSAAYGNRVINGGATEAEARREHNELLDMILGQAPTAEYIVRKIYRWFVDYIVDESVETHIIKPLAQIFRDADFEIAPVLQTLFTSQHFYDATRVGAMIKTPADLVIGTGRMFKIDLFFPDPVTELPRTNWAYRTLRRIMGTMGMDIMNPPNVAGWPAYWQEPVYHRIWINADTLQKRVKYCTDLAVDKLRLDEMDYGSGAEIDAIEAAKMSDTPDDAGAMIADLCRYIFAVPVSAGQQAVLKDQLLAGSPDAMWANEWSAMIADPDNETKTQPVITRLRRMLKYMLSMAEYQLC